MKWHAQVSKAALLLAVLTFTSCGRNEQPQSPDNPRLTPDVKMIDVTFHSAALNRDMQYRVLLPAHMVPGQKLPVLYLLHGIGGTDTEWTQACPANNVIDNLLAEGRIPPMVVVFPDGTLIRQSVLRVEPTIVLYALEHLKEAFPGREAMWSWAAEPVASLNGFGTDNYYHFLTDTICNFWLH